MNDVQFAAEVVRPEFLPIFKQLDGEFGNSYEIWRRTESLGRWHSAAVLNPKTGAAVFVPLLTSEIKRVALLTSDEVRRIRAHLESGAAVDISL